VVEWSFPSPWQWRTAPRKRASPPARGTFSERTGLVPRRPNIREGPWLEEHGRYRGRVTLLSSW